MLNRKLLFTSFLILFLSFISCSKESVLYSDEESEIINSKPDAIANQRTGGLHGSYNNVFAPIVEEEVCGPNKRLYTIYASASETSNQDREVQVAVLKGQDFIEAKLVIIPAGQHVSSNVSIFSYSNQSHGSVSSKAYNVLVNGNIQSGYNFPSISYSVSNCYNSSASCYEGIYPPDDPSTAANEGSGDEDSDGECNKTDLDDNGNGTLDAWE